LNGKVPEWGTIVAFSGANGKNGGHHAYTGVQPIRESK
jgi:hypothetical protein